MFLAQRATSLSASARALSRTRPALQNSLSTKRFLAAAALPDEADVVVIGGGSLGASTLYHLADRGVNAVLVEKDLLTAGTTWHSAGMLWNLRPDDSGQEISRYTRKMCTQLEATI
jgi:sarcosine dehydrogenase